MRIRDVEALTGLSRKTIRFYEAKGLLCVDRSDNSYREYDESVVEQLKGIALLRQAGISLADIQLWQDHVISSAEMLNKRLSELRDAADIAMDQVKLCSQLLDGELRDWADMAADRNVDEPAEEDPEVILAAPCIGIDIGTTTISAVVLDIASGMTAGVYTIANTSNIPAEHVWEKMQDAEQILRRIRKLLDSLLRRYPGIRSIGITGQMHGILYINNEGNLLSPLYTWQDERAGVGNPSPCQILFQRTGYRISSGYGLAAHFAHSICGTVPAGAAKICTIMDYIVMNLCGRTVPVMHSSDAASLGFYLPEKNGFDTELLQQAGINPDILPPVTAKCEIVGTFRNIPVAVAIGDNQASFIGAVKEPEHSVLANFGTGSQISVMCHWDLQQDVRTDASTEIRPFLESSFLVSGSALCGGRAYTLMERFFRRYAAACGMNDTEQYEVMNKLAAKGIEEGSCLEVRTTFCGTRNDPALRGSIVGISEENLTPEAMIAGTLWGMASELYEMFRKMPHHHIDTLVISGNAVRKNPALRQMLKHVFGMEVYLPVHKEEAAFGAAMFSALASGCAGDYDDLTSCVQYTICMQDSDI